MHNDPVVDEAGESRHAHAERFDSDQQMDLNDRWLFSPDPHGDGESLGFWRAAYNARLWREVTVPSCFEAGGPNLDFYQGRCWYRRTFAMPGNWNERRIVLRFEAVNYRAKVWLNDRFLGENQDGFLPFEFAVPAAGLRTDGNVLAVAVDNAHHPGDVPGMHVGWRGFGGIIREVSLRATDPLFVEDVRVQAVPADQGGDTEFRVQVMNTRDSAGQVGLDVAIRDSDDKIQARLTAAPEVVEAGAVREFVLTGHMDTVRLWAPATPNLYNATVRLTADGRSAAEHELAFGFRRIEVSGDALLLNGEKIFLTGFNRHDDSPRTDMAVDHELIRRDLDAIKESGANMVRLCHYPHHPAELDYCDRIGLLVFAEIPLYFWNDANEGKQTNAERTQTATRQLERMIARDFNHPSILFWSVSNETHEEEPEVTESNRQLIRHCRALDPSRLHVHVSNRWLDFEEDDVICLNAYPSIEWPEGGHNPAAYADGKEAAKWWHDKLTGIRQRYPGKPVLVTEFGYGSFAGTHGHSFGEDEHARVIAAEFGALTEALVCGALIWCWADHAWPAGRFLGGISVSPFGVLDRKRNRLKPFQTARKLFRTKQALQEPEEKKAAKNNTNVIMIRPHMRELPVVPFQEGYGIRSMTPHDIGLWTDIQLDAEPYIHIRQDTFMHEFGDDPGMLARRCFIITGPRQLGVGTISAWYEQDFHGEEYGRIHWVAVRPAAQGNGLGKAALAYAMQRMAQWHDKCYLVTSTERIPAIRLYLKFGFVPDMRAPNAEENWSGLSDLLKEAGLS